MEQCVMTAGTMKMPPLSAHNLDSLDMVHNIYVDDHVGLCTCINFVLVFTCILLCTLLLIIILCDKLVVVEC